MATFVNDLRYALRQLRKTPGFTITAVVNLALGIGISAAMFTVVDGVLLRPLPVPHPSKIVALGESATGNSFSTSSLPDVQDWQAQSKSFQSLAWYTQTFFNLKKPDGSVDFALNSQTSPNFFSMLQAQPMLGRTFLPQDVHGGQGNVAVLSQYVWRNYFARDPAILGKALQLGAATYTVIGVMPKHFYIPINDDGPVVWTLLTPNPSIKRENQFLQVIGRLRPGVSIAEAKAELNGIQANIFRQYGNLGLLCAFFLGRFVRSFLYGVNQHDGATLIVVAFILALVGLLAAYIPARRASRIEPTEALRTE